MKLWQKISAVSIAVTLLTMSTAVSAIIAIQASARRRADEEQIRSSIDVFCSNCVSAVSAQGGVYRDVTLQSMVQFYFSQFASVLRYENVYYSLSADGEYLFNLCPYDPALLSEQHSLPESTEEEPYLFRTLSEQGESLLVCSRSFTVSQSQQEFRVYITKNVSETERQITRYRLIGFGTLAFACAVSALLTALLLRSALKPIALLTKTADAISKGNYRLRTDCSSHDEIGQLSAAFDRMSEAMEGKIDSLDQELEQKEFLIGALSHEIKTPMTAVMGYGETLLRMPLDREQQMVCAGKIVEAGRRAETLSRKMMELISLTEQHPDGKRQFLVSGLVESLRSVYPQRVRFAVKAEFVYGDETLLYSLTANLIQNSLRASPGNTEVTVSIEEKGVFTVIEVRDQGCGIPPEHIQHVTEPFYRVDKDRSRKAGGAGLGLAICSRIAAWHGGTLDIESRVGERTVVRVSIPALTT